MRNKFPHWLEITTLVVLMLNAPLVLMELIPAISSRLPLNGLEWGFTIIFTIEYFMRIFYAQDKRAYIFGLDGVLDLVATLPQYILLFVPEAGALYIARALRLVRLIARRWRAAREVQELMHHAHESKKPHDH